MINSSVPLKLHRKYVAIISYALIFCASFFSPAAISASGSELKLKNNSWAEFIAQSLSQHPDIKLAKSQLMTNQAIAETSIQPLYNPTVNFDIDEQVDGPEVTIGVEQTIDIWNKREANKGALGIKTKMQSLEYKNTVEQTVSNALQSIIQWQSSKQMLSIANQQQDHLNKLMNTVNRQYRAGEISYLDLQLTKVAQASIQYEIHTLEGRYKTAKTSLKQWFPTFDQAQLNKPIPNKLLAAIKPVLEVKPESLRDFKIAKLGIDEMQFEADKTRINAKPEPTIGVTASSSDGQNLLGVSISMPLNVRNNFSKSIEAADQQVLTSMSQLSSQKSLLNQKSEQAWNDLNVKRKSYQSINNAFQQKKSVYLRSLLNKRLALNDITVTEYLQTVDILLNTQTTYLEAKREYLSSQINLLTVTNQLLPFFNLLNGEES